MVGFQIHDRHVRFVLPMPDPADREFTHTPVRGDKLGRPILNLLNVEEELRIRELIDTRTWPNGWSGDEPVADTPMDKIYANGAVEPLLVW
jgi:hypothetical protein